MELTGIQVQQESQATTEDLESVILIQGVQITAWRVLRLLRQGGKSCI